jgi:hypothetical protein
MNQQIQNIAKTRNYLLEQLKELTHEELNTIPPGFNNNIVWNLGHIVAAQQGICYMRGSLPAIIVDSFFSMYKPGSKPERKIEPDEIDKIRDLLSSTLERLEEDYANNIFTGYKPWTTRYGVEIKNIDEAISFLLFHEGLHGGVMASQKKLVQKK